MKLQIVKDSKGKDTGVFIPFEDWIAIKQIYPEIEIADQELSQWEKDLIDQRLEKIKNDPKSLKAGQELIEELKK
ncbi:addiction module component CHP02574 family protein [Algoriphagus hitonicola]|uniref:Addiction module component n=1 Tax=Algoriphagus hitonicola TaxID=435880 RepID=A0A1I2WGT5_9BACT|nr:addiction module component CHP02574 family protein [Algoriphagus hitonicola]SFG99526.1 hypothetical protein SAMN04487988_11294 [Algoriphagus hitonicola]